MSLTLAGAAALSAASGALGNIASSGIQYAANKQLQEDAQSFNAQEAEIARQFSREEAATARQFSHDEALMSRQFSHDEAQLARDFESTKYQRTIADMKAAGINPASVGMSPPTGGAPMASSASMASSSAASGASASSGSNSISNPNIGNILTSAFNSAMIQSLQDERFAKSLVERTAFHASKIDNEIKRIESQSKDYRLRTNAWKHQKQKSSDPKWLKGYVKNFESGVHDL